jgi:hypothetical protein
MNSFSHILIGKLLYTYLEQNCGMTLHKPSFLYGNILPDCTRRFKKMPHEPEYWDQYLRKEVAALTGQQKPALYFERSYSRRLGIICHFYADFFCYAHTQAYTGGLYPHMKYEWELHQRMVKSLGAICGTDYSAEENTMDEPALIHACYTRLLRQYLDLAPSFEKDISYTMNACTTLVTAVTAASAAAVWTPAAGSLAYGSAKA